MALPPSYHAPEFQLDSTHGTVSLRDLRGKNVVLVFYPGDWTPVCGGQLDIYNELRDVWHSLNAVILGISVDSVASHRAWSAERGISIPLLADFEPKGAVAQQYDVYNKTTGTTDRAIFVIDGAGVIRWSYLSPYQENPGANGIIATLEDIEGKPRTASKFPYLVDPVRFDDHVRGTGVTLVEYGDLQCPNCQYAHEVLKTVAAPYMLVFRHFPLRNVHEHAQLAAAATEAAASQGKFWEMHDMILANQEQLSVEFIHAAAQSLGLNLDQFERELNGKVSASRVHYDFVSGCRSGVTRTPTFFINGERYEGEIEKGALEDALQGSYFAGKEGVTA